MNAKLKRTLTMFTVLVMLLSMTPTILPATALSGNVESVKAPASAYNAPAHDISTMSFNVLATGSDHADAMTRFPYIIQTVQKYMPDIIGIQEAVDATYVRKENNYSDMYSAGFNWADKLETELGKLGYTSRRITSENPYPVTGRTIVEKCMTIGAGLMIFYKTDRFTFTNTSANHGSGRYDATYTYNGKTTTDSSRFYHYIKLFDKKFSTYVYAFNTHFSITPDADGDSIRYNSPADIAAGKQLCWQEATILSAKMKELSENYPCFAFGDYNCRLNKSEEGATDYTEQLYKMSNDTPFVSSGVVADVCRPADAKDTIDHCFINTNYTHVTQRLRPAEEFNGIQTSDHRPIVTYANYHANVSFANGTYNAADATFTDSTDSATYQLNMTSPNNDFTCKIYDEDGNLLSTNFATALDLNKHINTFKIEFYSSTCNTATAYNTVTATITNTAIADTAPAEFAATNSVRAYYANGAYYADIAEGKTATALTFGGSAHTLYADADCTKTKSTSSLSKGLNTYYVKLNNKAYPVYIRCLTGTAKANALYIDDDFAGLTGKHYYSDNYDTVEITLGTNGFATVADALGKAKAGYTIYMAPGHYDVSSTISPKNIAFLGNNRDKNPINRSEEAWTLSSDRNPETEITGSLTVNTTNQTTTVRGFKFTGGTANGQLNFTGSGVNNTLTLDIQNNIFDCYTTNSTTGSAIRINTNAQKKGMIANNYFCPSQTPTYINNDTHVESYTANRAITMRNVNGLTLSGNYFKNYTTVYYFSSETSGGVTTAGNMNLTVAYNRFEDCGTTSNYLCCVYGSSSAHIKYLYNDFVNCGKGSNSPILNIYTNETAKQAAANLTNDYANCSVEIYGNRFIECYRSIRISRDTRVDPLGDLSQMPLTIQQNRIFNPNQFQVPYTIQFLGYVDSTKEPNILCDKWNVNYNYIYSQKKNSTDPADYVYAKVSDTSNDVYVKFNSAPYYTDANLTTLSSGTNQTMNVAVAQNTFTYDSEAHSVALSGVPEGAVVSYSANQHDWTTVVPTLTDAGSVTVYYQVEKEGCTPVVGNTVLTVEKALLDGIVSLEGFEGNYDGNAHGVTIDGLENGDTVTYSTDGEVFTATAPTLTDFGSMTVYVHIERENYEPITLQANVTVYALAVPKGDVVITNYDSKYDGEPHTVTVKANGYTLEYSTDGKVFTATAPTLTDVGKLKFKVRATKVGYQSVFDASIVIRDAGHVPGVYVTNYEGAFDNQSHSVTINGLQEGDTVAYSVDGENYGSENPSFTDIGVHSVYVKVSRDNYSDTLFMATVAISNDLPQRLFDITLSAAGVEKKDDGSYSLYWEIHHSINESFDFSAYDIKVLSYGIRYSTSADLLQNYIYNSRYNLPVDGIKNIASWIYDSDDFSLPHIYRDYSYRINKVGSNKIRAAVAYITYECNGVIYEEYSSIDATSTILGGMVSGNGGTQEGDDIFDD